MLLPFFDSPASFLYLLNGTGVDAIQQNALPGFGVKFGRFLNFLRITFSSRVSVLDLFCALFIASRFEHTDPL